jgi:hypothetical protein
VPWSRSCVRCRRERERERERESDRNKDRDKGSIAGVAIRSGFCCWEISISQRVCCFDRGCRPRRAPLLCMRGCHQTHGDVEMRAPPVPLLRMQGGCLCCGCKEGASAADARMVPLLGCLPCRRQRDACPAGIWMPSEPRRRRDAGPLSVPLLTDCCRVGRRRGSYQTPSFPPYPLTARCTPSPPRGARGTPGRGTACVPSRNGREDPLPSLPWSAPPLPSLPPLEQGAAPGGGFQSGSARE